MMIIKIIEVNFQINCNIYLWEKQKRDNMRFIKIILKLSKILFNKMEEFLNKINQMNKNINQQHY